MIHMQQTLADNITYLIGSEEHLENMIKAPADIPFSDEVVMFLNDLAGEIRRDEDARKYSDIQTFAFWCRKASVLEMKRRYADLDQRIGRGITFHIAPSNIPMMFMFSVVVSLLAGNSNIVRLSSKYFPQTDIICRILKKLFEERYQNIADRIIICQYPHSEEITGYFSKICNSRIIWGGDNSINEIRKIQIPSYAIDLPFFDRFSFAVIDADAYLASNTKSKIAEQFYNDTYFTDQNACTSPQLVIWRGKEHAEEASEAFWKELKIVVDKKYEFQSVQAVDKLSAMCDFAIDHHEGRLIEDDMSLCRMRIDKLYSQLKDYRCPGGYFYEYITDNLQDLSVLMTRECQTVDVYGIERREILDVMKKNHGQGVDRIVEIGHTMDFGLQWDGFDFIYSLSRVVS